jgi:hypothetical protein
LTKQSEEFISKYRDNQDLTNHKNGDFYSDSKQCFLNLSTDLLKYVYFFTLAKSTQNCAVILRKEDVPILETYSGLFSAKGAEIYEYRNPEDFVPH